MNIHRSRRLYDLVEALQPQQLKVVIAFAQVKSMSSFLPHDLTPFNKILRLVPLTTQTIAHIPHDKYTSFGLVEGKELDWFTCRVPADEEVDGALIGGQRLAIWSAPLVKYMSTAVSTDPSHNIINESKLNCLLAWSRFSPRIETNWAMASLYGLVGVGAGAGAGAEAGMGVAAAGVAGATGDIAGSAAACFG